MEKFLPVTVYADTTGQFTEEELTAMESRPMGQMIEIPVPEGLLKTWWHECLQFDREECCDAPEGGWPPVSDADFYDWVYKYSTADDSVSLCAWLAEHGCTWRRLDD